MNYYYAGGIVAVLLILFAGYKNVFGSRFKRMSVDFMTKAQYSRLGRNALADSIAKFRKGTMDEKMVLVIANLIEHVPGLSTVYTFFPKKTVVNFLYSKTQAMFDLCESALKGYKKYPIPLDHYQLGEMTTELKELDNSQLDKIQEATDEFRKVLPTIEKLNPLLDELPKIIELVRIFTDKKDDTKKATPDIALVDNMTVAPDKEDVNTVHIVTKGDTDGDKFAEERALAESIKEEENTDLVKQISKSLDNRKKDRKYNKRDYSILKGFFFKKMFKNTKGVPKDLVTDFSELLDSIADMFILAYEINVVRVEKSIEEHVKDINEKNYVISKNKAILLSYLVISDLMHVYKDPSKRWTFVSIENEIYNKNVDESYLYRTYQNLLRGVTVLVNFEANKSTEKLSKDEQSVQKIRESIMSVEKVEVEGE